MNLTGKTSKPANGNDRLAGHKMALWLRVLAWVVMLAFAGSVSLGVPLHSNSSDCNIPEMEMGDCEHMGMDASSLEGLPFCCILESQEPAPLGSAPKIRTPPCSSDFLDTVARPSQLNLQRTFPHVRCPQHGSFTPADTYLKNHSLLI